MTKKAYLCYNTNTVNYGISRFFQLLMEDNLLMTATVRIKKDRPFYYIVIRYPDETTNEERQKWVTTDIPVKGNNKRKAEKLRAEVLAQHEASKIDLGKDALFTDFIIDWLDTQISSKKIAATTHEAYEMNLSVHILPYFMPLKLKVKEVEPRHIQKYVNAKMKALSPNTVKKHITNISACLESAVRQNIIAFNPATRIEPIRKVKYTGAKFFREDQIDHLLECSKGDPLEVVIMLTLFYALRRSEVLGLKWRAIDFENNTISICHTVVKITKVTHKQDLTKNESSNDTLPLPDMIKSYLLKWKAQQAVNRQMQPIDYVDSDYVCTMVDGSHIRPDYVSQHFALLLERNGMPHIRFHDLRHSSGSYLQSIGFKVVELQTWLRHADIKSTMIYDHMDMSEKWKIADDLNQRFSNFSSNQETGDKIGDVDIIHPNK